MAILNRKVCWMEWGLELRADSRHAEEIVTGMGLSKESKGLDALGKERPDEEEGGGEGMNAGDAKR